MKKILIVISASLLSTGCSGQFWGGAGTGAVGAGAAYELRGQQQLRELDKERKAGKITQQEYDLRRKQIERDYLLK